MFQDDLFTIVSEEKAEQSADFIIRLNRSHSIYSGHFPDDAITPGVCIMQMAVDLFSHIMQREHVVAKAKNIKFIQVIRPDEHPQVHYRLTWESDELLSTVKVVVDAGDTLFSKMSLQLKAN